MARCEDDTRPASLATTTALAWADGTVAGGGYMQSLPVWRQYVLMGQLSQREPVQKGRRLGRTARVNTDAQ
jgi:hypothetical protein